MICNKKAGRIYKNLKGFVNEDTIKKYIDINQKSLKKKYIYNPNKLLIGIILFCGSLFICHLYTLWERYKKDKNDNNFNIDLNIVPPSGIY